MGTQDDDEEKDKKKAILQNNLKKSSQYKILYEKYIQNQNGGGEKKLDQWENQQENGPVAYFDTIVKKYGEPDIMINKKGGICIWYIKNRDNDPHEEIWLRDEYVAHSKPKNHYDFLYSYVKIFIPKEKLWTVLAISGSVNYDPLKHMLFARCGSFNANFATIKTVFETMNNKETEYKTNITNALGEKKEEELISNEEYVKNEVQKNQKKYKTEIENDFYIFLKK